MDLANSPGFTQLIEQNEPTSMPLSSMGSVKGFCKKAAWEDDTSDSTGEEWEQDSNWWKPEEERKEENREEIKDLIERKLNAIPPEGKVIEIPGTEELSRLPGKITPDNVKELFKQYLNEYFTKDIAAINRDIVARDEGDPIISVEQADNTEYGFSGSISIWNSFLDAHGNYDGEILAGHPDTTTDPKTLWGAWKEIIKEDPTLVDRIDAELKDTAEKIKKDYAHSPEDLDKWLQSSDAKRFCKKAAWEDEDEDDPTLAGEWWKSEEEQNTHSRDSAEDWKPEEEREKGLTPEEDAQIKKIWEIRKKRDKEQIEERKREWEKKTPEEKIEHFLRDNWSKFISSKLQQGVDPRKLQSNLEHYWGPFIKELERLGDSNTDKANELEIEDALIQKLYPKIVYDPRVQQYISTAIERLKPKELGSEVQGLGPEIGGEYDLYGDWIAWIDYELGGGQGSEEKDPKEIESDINQVWDRFLKGTKEMLLNDTGIPEEEWQMIEDRSQVVKDKLIEEGVKYLNKATSQDTEESPSSEDLDKWLQSSDAKRFCKRG